MSSAVSIACPAHLTVGPSRPTVTRISSQGGAHHAQSLPLNGPDARRSGSGGNAGPRRRHRIWPIGSYVVRKRAWRVNSCYACFTPSSRAASWNSSSIRSSSSSAIGSRPEPRRSRNGRGRKPANDPHGGNWQVASFA